MGSVFTWQGYMTCGLGQLSRYSYSLRAGRSRDRIPVGGEIFRTSPDRPWGPASFLYNGYRVFPGGKAAGAWRWPPTPSSAVVEGRVKLYICSPSGPSWPVLGWTFRVYDSVPTICAKALSTLEWLCQLLKYYRPMYLGPILFTETSCHKTGTGLIPCAALLLPLCPLPLLISFNKREIDCIDVNNATTLLLQRPYSPH